MIVVTNGKKGVNGELKGKKGRNDNGGSSTSLGQLFNFLILIDFDYQDREKCVRV